MSAAVDAPVVVMENAGEGGAWGIAILALYACKTEKKFEEFLNDLFKESKKVTVSADEKEKEKFGGFMELYKKGLEIEKQASEIM